MKTPPIEYQILLAASRTESCQEQRQKLMGLITTHFNQDQLVEMAVREGVAGLLYKNLKKSRVLGYLAHQHIGRLQSAYYLTVRFNLKLIYDLKEVLQRLNKKNIKVVLLKNRLYPNIFKKASTIIDLNTHILWADRIQSRKMLINKKQEVLFQNCRIIDFEGQKAYGLGRVDQVIYLSLHAIKHYADRLIWLVDLKNLLQDWQSSDWELLRTRCKELGQENAIDFILILLTQLFDLRKSITAPVSLDVNHLNQLEKMVMENRLNGKPLPSWSPMLLLTSGKGFSKKAAFIFESLFPRPEILRQVFANTPDLKIWQLYLKRALQLVGQVKL
jgi:hypothetical protein